MTLYTSALVTGAGRGIGAATVRKLCAAGLAVHAVARSAEPLKALAGETGCIPHVLDVTDNAAVEAAFGDLAVDVLVNNAGVAGPDGPIHEQDPAVLKRILEVNVEGAAAMLRAMTQNLRIELYGKRIRVTEIAPARVETYFHAQQFFGDRAATKRDLYDGFESLKPEDIADAIAYCIGAPERVDVTLMEILPTLQVIGGINFHRDET
jgi:NADP-dependent 3-hydroxy acid dehydrogenase YdfG